MLILTYWCDSLFNAVTFAVVLSFSVTVDFPCFPCIQRTDARPVKLRVSFLYSWLVGAQAVLLFTDAKRYSWKFFFSSVPIYLLCR